ncbi:arylesterase [Deltaproteobacteria bacterium IMCC39524]|nr:arylesterase [Deltaproteobacteria bacterium IMCC39524]
MRRSIFLIFTLFFSGLLFTGCDSGPGIKPFNQESVVLAFGDSLTHGTGASAGQSYPDVLSELLGRQVINGGIPGEVSAAGLKRLPAVLEEYKPTLVILCHGGNDFLRKLNQATTSSNLDAMITLIRSRGADIVLVGVPKVGFGLQVPELYSKIADQHTIPLQKEILVDLLSDNSMKSDVIHPNATGYRLMAEAIYDLINRAQKK